MDRSIIMMCIAGMTNSQYESIDNLEEVAFKFI